MGTEALLRRPHRPAMGPTFQRHPDESTAAYVARLRVLQRQVAEQLSATERELWAAHARVNGVDGVSAAGLIPARPVTLPVAEEGEETPARAEAPERREPAVPASV